MALFLCSLPLESQSSPGASPKESLSPKMYKELSGESVPAMDTTLTEIRNQLRVFTAQHQMLYQQLAVVQQHLSDIDRQLNTNRAEIDASGSNQLSERLVKLEDFMISEIKSDEAAAAASDRRMQEVMSWARGAALALMGLIANEAWKRWRDKLRRRRRDGAVDHKLDEMATTITELRDNTNGKMDELLQVTAIQEHAAGVQEGQKRQLDSGS